MEKQIIDKLTQLRYAVGFLGEKPQFNWWPSNFLNISTLKMFEFTFPRTANLAQYMAVSAAAAKVHDESIGVGKSFHLFRLPEFMEKSLISSIQSNNSNDIDQDITSKENALNLLSEIAGTASLSGEGPINLGQVNDGKWATSISQIASAYLQAFNENKKAFPYFQGDI
ncbi:BrxE family protein [Aliiglaciecola sp. 2_MG-2023]|uniref:BrxE family protein n=1 Tax=unclassified Aliiglaciecola TaxID=2593648 RepID=UPI0026E48C12|nr:MULTISPECIES: BrxE family protein [unclassified Aliiglaciecola]MDO6710345.1 BrxE family protein [Aliiglaciecola sp. 2_MG-2023]MDO6751492.1 BrxE family protein [Aliiglaciecola sp. 1_MG-2023]